MSGGRFNYNDGTLFRDIFGWGIDYDYDLRRPENDANRKEIRRQNVFEDKEISELIYDVFCLIRSYDWYASGDTGEDDYQKDVKYFKKKWLAPTSDERYKEIVDKSIEECKEELYKILGI